MDGDPGSINDGSNDCGCSKDDRPNCNPDEEEKIVFITEDWDRLTRHKFNVNFIITS